MAAVGPDKPAGSGVGVTTASPATGTTGSERTVPADDTAADLTEKLAPLSLQDVAGSQRDGRVAGMACLDDLPPELLQEVVSRLDYISLLSLERVSSRCRDAVALHLSRLRSFRLDRSEWRHICSDPGSRPGLLSRQSKAVSLLTDLLLRMSGLRELDIDHMDYSSARSERVCPKELRQALVDSSSHWPQLEKLRMIWMRSSESDESLLKRLCANCPRLSDVTLIDRISDAGLQVLVSALPGLRALHVSAGVEAGAFFSQLPTELNALTVSCFTFRRGTLANLSRCVGLQRLSLHEGWFKVPMDYQIDDIGVMLTSLVRLERLSLTCRGVLPLACLPSSGLPTLRHLSLTHVKITDGELGRLVERLPDLEALTLCRCCGPTSRGLARLGRLSALRSLSLSGMDGITDDLLKELSAAPLVELELPIHTRRGSYSERWSTFTGYTLDGVLQLRRRCSSLRTLILWNSPRALVVGGKRIDCGPDLTEHDVVKAIRSFMDYGS